MSDSASGIGSQKQQYKPPKQVEEQPKQFVKPTGGENIDGGKALTASLEQAEKSGVVV